MEKLPQRKTNVNGTRLSNKTDLFTLTSLTQLKSIFRGINTKVKQLKLVTSDWGQILLCTDAKTKESELLISALNPVEEVAGNAAMSRKR